MASREVYRTTLLTNAQNGGQPFLNANIDGRFTFWAFGTWDSATAVMQFSPDAGTTWLAIPSASISTANAAVTLQGCYRDVRVAISGGLGGESLTVGIDIGAST